MQVTAPAKINLTLRVLGKRMDGFHALESVMQMISLYDALTIYDDPEINFTCTDPELENSNNLVIRAAHLLQAHATGTPRGARIHLHKNIPMQAGLGGGSTDAAAALAALNEFWDIRLPMEKLMVLAATLGSDVPFFLAGLPTAIVRGRGEEVLPLLHHSAIHVVLAKPSAGLSTAEVYRRLYAPRAGTLGKYFLETEEMLQALAMGDITAISHGLVNDLEKPAYRLLPELAHGCMRMYEAGCMGVLLCGSGSALFGLCPDAATAEHAALDLSNDFPWTTTAQFITPR